MPPAFLCEPSYWALRWASTHLRRFPGSSVHALGKEAEVEAFLDALPDRSGIVLASEVIPDVELSSGWSAALRRIASRGHQVLGIVSEVQIARWLVEIIRPLGIELRPMFRAALHFARILAAPGADGEKNFLRATMYRESTQGSAPGTSAEGDDRQLTESEEDALDVAREPEVIPPPYAPPIFQVDGSLRPDGWPLLAYFGLQVGSVGEHRAEPTEYLSLVKVLAAGDEPDEWARKRIESGRELLTTVRAALSFAPDSDKRVLMLDSGLLGPAPVRDFLAHGVDALTMLADTAAEWNARVLLISLPFPGASRQLIFYVGKEELNLPAGMPTLQLTPWGDGYMIPGELSDVVSEVVRFFVGLN